MAAQTTSYKCLACAGPMHFNGQSGKLQCDYCESTFTPQEVEIYYAEKEKSAAEALLKQEQKNAPQGQNMPPQGYNNVPQQGQNIPTQGQNVPPQGYNNMPPQGQNMPPQGYNNMPPQGQNGGAGTAAVFAPYTPGANNIPQTAANGGADNLWTTAHLNTNWGNDAENMRTYSCTSCGAEIICDATTAATSCIYCNNPTVVPGHFAGAIKPDYVIPFKLDKAAAKKALADFCKGKFLLPRFFSKENHIEEIKGVYVPFWLFDGAVDANVYYKASNSTTVSSGDYNVTTTHHYNIQRAGVIHFSDIPIDASSKMPDKYMESIEPFDYSEMKPFSTAYMPGYFADKYDVEVNQCSARADERAVTTAMDVLRQSVKGYSKCTETNRQVFLSRGDVQYALAPVWMLSTRYRGANYIFAMNGQTGKFVGKLPCDFVKLFTFVAGLAVGISIVMYILLQMLM